MKPILVKAGIPIAVSFAGFILSMITSRRILHSKSSSSQTRVSSHETDSEEEFRDQESFHGLDSASSTFKEEEQQIITRTQIMNSLVNLHIQERPRLEEEILGLKCLVRTLQNRELELETLFIHYCELKDQELILNQLQNMLVLEAAHVEFLGLMVESMEAESGRLEAMVVEYLRVVEQLQSANMENGLLEMKVKKLLRKTSKHGRLFRIQASALRAKEAEVSRNHQELEQKENLIEDLKDEIMALKRIVDQLEEEKKELGEKLELVETSASSTSKIVEEVSAIDHQNQQLLTELEQLRNVRVAEAEELIHLRWINACLRHELTKNEEQQRHEQEDNKDEPLELEFEGKNEETDHNQGYESDNLSMVNENGEPCAGITGTNHKKPKLLNKFKRWVKGNEKCKRSCNEGEEYQKKCFGRQSVSDEPSEQHVAARKSCSSA
ncbi:hypothetical protein BVC80_9057g28 [Macleaya cordata]|uniref:Uncharacterized protein n=1 Tax=Macleaya cordata TaxID=56857 RepID=A0A200R9P9_MACCD|nr:hypothetical protein BVC80_9057g28 [Macleaya cordata]